MGFKWRKLFRFGTIMQTAMLVDAIRWNWESIKDKLEHAKDQAGNELMLDPEIRPLVKGLEELWRSVKR